LLGAAPAFLQLLSRGDAQRLTAAVVSAHGLSQLAHALATPSSDAPSDSGDVRSPAHAARRIESADSPAVAAPEMRPPWASVAPEAVALQVPREQQILAGITLMLRRQPVV